MHKIDVGIIIGGSLLTIATLVGVIGISSSKINSMNEAYVSNVSENLSSYTHEYNTKLYANVSSLLAEKNGYSDNPNDTTIQVNVDSDDATNVTITHNGETVDDTNIHSDQSVNINVIVDDDGQAIVDVTNPEDEKPVIIDGKEVYVSELLMKQDDGTLAYLIRPGDTLCYISQLFGYSVPEIAEFNHVPNVNLIYADSIMRVPNWDHIKSDDTEDSKTDK